MRSVWRRVGSSSYPEGKQFWEDVLGCHLTFELEVSSASEIEGDLQSWRVSGVQECVWISLNSKEYVQQRLC